MKTRFPFGIQLRRVSHGSSVGANSIGRVFRYTRRVGSRGRGTKKARP